MEESDIALATIKELIEKVLAECTDASLLDLIYKLLLTNQ
jgi:hypothetical protein